MSRMMIRNGSPKAVVGAGFNLLAKAVVDQHFIRRHRQERLLGVLAEHPEMVGLGIDEGAALVVQGDHLRVLGDSQVIVYKEVRGSTTPWTETLQPGEEFDLVARPASPTADVTAADASSPSETKSDPTALAPVLERRALADRSIGR